MGEIVSDDEIPSGDEIRLDAGRADLISSTAVDLISEADFFLAEQGFHSVYRILLAPADAS